MPKATLTFDLPEDRVEHLTAVKAMDLCLVLWELKGKLRDWLKYESGGWTEMSPSQVLEMVQKELHDLLEERGVWDVIDSP